MKARKLIKRKIVAKVHMLNRDHCPLWYSSDLNLISHVFSCHIRGLYSFLRLNFTHLLISRRKY